MSDPTRRVNADDDIRAMIASLVGEAWWENLWVETPVSLADTPENRNLIHCSECGVEDEDPFYRREELVIVRHWKAGTGSDLGIYCPEHASRRSVWVNSHLAPDHLLPRWLAEKKAILANQVCLEDVGLGGRCGGPAADVRNGKPMCEDHLERFDRQADIAARRQALGLD